MDKTNLIKKLQVLSTSNKNDVKTLLSKYLINNISKVDKLSIVELSSNCHCSKSAIVKFCKELNLDGFKELIRILIWENSILKVVNSKNFASNNNYFEIISQNINYLMNQNFNKYLEVSQLLKKENVKVFLFGKGPNIHVTDVFRNYLNKLSINCYSSTDFDVQKRLSSNVKENDICFFFSYSGLTSEINELFATVIKVNPTTIVCTSNVDSILFKNSKFSFLVENNEEVLEDQTSSIISFLSIIMQILFLIKK